MSDSAEIADAQRIALRTLPGRPFVEILPARTYVCLDDASLRLTDSLGSVLDVIVEPSEVCRLRPIELSVVVSQTAKYF